MGDPGKMANNECSDWVKNSDIELCLEKVDLGRGRGALGQSSCTARPGASHGNQWPPVIRVHVRCSRIGRVGLGSEHTHDVILEMRVE